MRFSRWMAIGVVLLGLHSSASAQNTNFPTRDFSPSNLSSALTGVKPGNVQFRTPDGKTLASGAVAPASTTSSNRFSISNLFPRLSGTSVTRGPQRPTNTNSGIPNSGTTFNPVGPVMSSVDNPGRAITLGGSASANRRSSFVIPSPITGR
jgi:hypothetical protein